MITEFKSFLIFILILQTTVKPKHHILAPRPHNLISQYFDIYIYNTCTCLTEPFFFFFSCMCTNKSLSPAIFHAAQEVKDRKSCQLVSNPSLFMTLPIEMAIHWRWSFFLWLPYSQYLFEARVFVFQIEEFDSTLWDRGAHHLCFPWGCMCPFISVLINDNCMEFDATKSS